MAAPQVLLRPCCCLARLTQVEQATEPDADQLAALPPCCRQRLLASQNSAAAQARAVDQRDGLHDASRCGCRPASTAVRVGRPVFKPLVDTSVVEHSPIPCHEYADSLALAARIRSAGDSPPPDRALTNCILLCRWQV